MRKFYPYFIITAMILLVLLVTTKGDFLYMSKMDYLSQHSAFPDYFRKLFYDTHDLFPSYAFNIGAGQNIYNFAYYGLLSPIVLVSYLLPAVDMAVYLMVVSIIMQIAGGILMYRLLLRISSKYPLLLTLLFVLATCLTFHSHRHLMFVSYMPFVILALHGVERYRETKKSWLYLISIFLILMTSFYFVLPSVIVISIYYLYRSYGSIKIKDFIGFVGRMLIPLLMSMVLILPVLFILFTNREVGGNVDILRLFVPQFRYLGLFYHPYGLGLTTFFGIVLIDNLLTKNKHRFLSIILMAFLMIPFFSFLLNGTLYTEIKIMIPFLPLFIILAGESLEHFHYKRTIPIFFVLVLLIAVNRYSLTNFQILLFTEIALTFIILYLRARMGWEKPLYLLVVFALVGSVLMSSGDELTTKQEYSALRNSTNKIHEYVRQNNNLFGNENANFIPHVEYYSDTVYSSLINQQFVRFNMEILNTPHSSRNNATFNSTDDIIQETIMGVKYVKTVNPSIGYKKYDNNQTYYNDNVLPLGYVNSSLVSQRAFNELDAAYRSDVLINHVVVADSNRPAISSVKKVDIDYELLASKDVKISGNTIVSKKSEGKAYLKFNKDLGNEILFLNLKLKKSGKKGGLDQRITINNVVNTQTCPGWKYDNKNNANGLNYVLSNIEEKALTLYLEKGEYRIEQVNMHLLDYDEIKNINQKIDPFVISSIKGDVIKGSIDVTKDGYFVFQTPYDKNYHITVDGSLIDYEKVNSSFIGFKLNQGSHEIQIEYKAKGQNVGFLLSLMGVLLLLVLMHLERKRSLTAVNPHRPLRT